MAALSIANNHHEPLPKGLLPETYGFIGLQIWQHYDRVLVQHLQNHYTVVCISIFYLQNYLEDRALLHPRVEGYVAFVEDRTASRKRVNAGIGEDNIFLLFKVFKEFKKQLIAYEQINQDSLVVKLKTNPLPAFFWNCNQSYPFEFDFEVLKTEDKISSHRLNSYFDWDFIDVYIEDLERGLLGDQEDVFEDQENLSWHKADFFEF